MVEEIEPWTSEILSKDYWIGNTQSEITHGQLYLLEFTFPLPTSKPQNNYKSIFNLQQTYNIGLDLLGNQYICATVPIHLSVIEFCDFIKDFSYAISELKVAKSQELEFYFIIIRLHTNEVANKFFNHFHGRKFNQIEEERCYLAGITEVLKFTKISGDGGDTESEAGELECPNTLFQFGNCVVPPVSCPICLEKIDIEEYGNVGNNVPGYNPPSPNNPLYRQGNYPISVLCNHYFHYVCLEKWKDSTCPLCRFEQSPKPFITCEICNAKEGLWACLICGSKSCLLHGIHHYQTTLHTYTMSLTNRYVWDYAKEGYVHRLIQNNVDGKLIEFEDPDFIIHQGGEQGFKSRKMIHQCQLKTKIHTLSSEFNLLLLSQLDTQREFYKNRIENLSMEITEERDKLVAENESLNDKLKVIRDSHISAEKVLIRGKEEMWNLEGESEYIKKKREGMSKEIEVGKKVQEMIEIKSKNRKEDWERKMDILESEIKGVRMDMEGAKIHINTQKRVEGSKYKSQIEEGTTFIIGGQSNTTATRKGKKRK